MADSLEESILQEGVLSRAWRDTQTCLHHWLFWVVETFGGGTVAMIAGPMWGLVFMAAVLAALLIINIALAPGRQRDEARGLLKGQQDRQLDLHVAIYSVFAKGPQGLHTLDLGREGAVIILKNIRFTNRSTTNRVSLDLTLMVPLHPPAMGKDYLSVGEEVTRWDRFPTDLFRSPVNIGPRDTESGDMCFLIPPEIVHQHGGKEALDFTHCRLEIIDLASGERVVKDIGQEVCEKSPVNNL